MTASRVRAALEGLAWQFAVRGSGPDGLTLSTGGLSALEDAFAALGWTDPQPVPDAGLACDVPGCRRWSTSGRATASGYQRVCDQHDRERST